MEKSQVLTYAPISGIKEYGIACAAKGYLAAQLFNLLPEDCEQPNFYVDFVSSKPYQNEETQENSKVTITFGKYYGVPYDTRSKGGSYNFTLGVWERQISEEEVNENVKNYLLQIRQAISKVFGIAKRSEPNSLGETTLRWKKEIPFLQIDLTIILENQEPSNACKIEEYEEIIPAQPERVVTKKRVICPEKENNINKIDELDEEMIRG